MPKFQPNNDWLALMGERVVAARQKKGWNQKQFAKRIKVTGAALCAWECGENAMSVGNLMQIVAKTGESTAYLLPESDYDEESIGNLSLHLGTILGHRMLRRLMEIPEARLRREIAAVIELWATEENFPV